jgi:hypothetical protein
MGTIGKEMMQTTNCANLDLHEEENYSQDEENNSS